MRHRIFAGLGLLLLWSVAVQAQDGDLVPLHPDLAARSYDAACSSCHYRGEGRAPFGTRGPLADGSPDELVQFILFGKAPEEDEGEGGMPAFGPVLTDADVTRLVIWLRSTSKPDEPWLDVAARVAALRTTGARED